MSAGATQAHRRSPRRTFLPLLPIKERIPFELRWLPRALLDEEWSCIHSFLLAQMIIQLRLPLNISQMLGQAAVHVRVVSRETHSPL
jgi:hypothetical protein